jgi:hypothetical protein
LEINLLKKTASLKKASRKSELFIYKPQIARMKRIGRMSGTGLQGTPVFYG